MFIPSIQDPSKPLQAHESLFCALLELCKYNSNQLSYGWKESTGLHRGRVLYKRARGDTVTKSSQGELMAMCNLEVESKTLSWVSFPNDKCLAGELPPGILTHAKFRELNVGLFKKTMMPVEQVLEDANIKKDDTDKSLSSCSQGQQLLN
ncbi:hypothetical protein BT96DRAFT_987751 [Gymnopus androsaceus JB14]|uniref:Uncharacterized protein n=1 Tax=Gymnopus androsaceus JB14 TaxID=1447944 RepID=A0A6A4IC03_9AGAR|nr:hypothetical protein BT96DRAFT_987751 [Gymnopus androsaceus JB14]